MRTAYREHSVCWEKNAEELRVFVSATHKYPQLESSIRPPLVDNALGLWLEEENKADVPILLDLADPLRTESDNLSKVRLAIAVCIGPHQIITGASVNEYSIIFLKPCGAVSAATVRSLAAVDDRSIPRPNLECTNGLLA